MNFPFLTFSDGAKFATVAKNLYLGNGFVTDFSFWGDKLFQTIGIPYLVPYLISVFFRLFGVNDFAVIACSFTFYVLLLIFTYLLATKLFGKLVGILSATALAFNINLIDYATSGASEPLFMFEIVLSLFLISKKKRWSDVLCIFVLGAMYFSRPQAFIYIAGIILYWLLNHFSIKKSVIIFASLAISGIIFDKLVLYPLSFKYPITPIFARGIQSILTYSTTDAISDGLRGAPSSTLTTIDVLKKAFYNLYNFYKAIPDIINPYIFALFIIGLTKVRSTFNLTVLFMVSLTFLVTALTIPFHRYLHPVVPLVYIAGIATLQEFVKSKKALVILILFFTVFQTLGILFLDSRFEKKLHNSGKPPIYVLQSHVLKNDTKSDDLIITNLDTWGSWYGERKTVWFPLTPKLVPDSEYQFDYIYLTSYKMDDANYYMGDDWREIFNNPETQTILSDYQFVKRYEFKSNDNYDNQNGEAILMKRK